MNGRLLINKKSIAGSCMAITGFLLSPLSWWNDLIVNIPLAYVFATLASLWIPNHFPMFMILGYWLTNIAGLVLFHSGVAKVITREPIRYSTKGLLKDLMLSLGYSVIIAILVLSGILKFPMEYLNN